MNREPGTPHWQSLRGKRGRTLAHVGAQVIVTPAGEILDRKDNCLLEESRKAGLQDKVKTPRDNDNQKRREQTDFPPEKFLRAIPLMVFLPNEKRRAFACRPKELLRNIDRFCVRVRVAIEELMDSPVNGMTD